MEKSKFVPGDLVLVNLPVNKRPSHRSGQIPRDGYWPAKITRKLPNCNRQVKCYATQEVIKVPVQSIVVYNKETIKPLKVDKDSVLAQALAEIEEDFVAKSRTAEEIHLSGGAKLVTSVVKSARLLDTIDVGNMLMNLWNSYLEKSLGKTLGICNLPRFIEDFVKEHKEVVLGQETYRDFMLHICSLEEVGLISSIEVKSIVESITQLNDTCFKDGNSNASVECPSDTSTDSTPPLVIECPDIIDVDIDSPIEITSSALKYAFPGEVLEKISDKSTSQLDGPHQAMLSDFPDKSVDAVSDITVLNITSVLKNAPPGQLSDKFWLNSRKRSPRSRNVNLPWLNSWRNSRARSKGRNIPGNRSRTRSSDRSVPWLSSRRSRTRSRDRNLGGASQQTHGLATTDRSEEQQMVMPYEPRVFPLSEEEYNKMMVQEASMDKEYNKMMAQECKKEITHDTPSTLECNKMMAQETRLTPGWVEMISQDTLVMPEVTKIVTQETPSSPECNEQVEHETPKGPQYNKLKAQRTPKTTRNKMLAQETPITPECNKQETPRLPDCNKMLAQKIGKAPKYKMVDQETPEYKARKCNKIVDQETTNPLQHEMVTLRVPEDKLEAQETAMVPLQPVVVDTTSSIFSDKSKESAIRVSKDGTFAIVLDSSFEAQTSLQGGATPAVTDYPPHSFNSTSNEMNYTYTEAIDCTFEDGKHASVVPSNTSEAQESLLDDATPTLVNDRPSHDVDVTSIVSKETSTESTSSISGDCYREAETNFLGDATPILVIDYPTYIGDATLSVVYDNTNSVTEDGCKDIVSKSPYEAQTSLLGDATPVLIIDYPDHIVDATSNLTNDASKSTNNIPEDGHLTVVSHSLSESLTNLVDGAMPAVEIDYPSSSSSIVYDATSKIVINNPTENATLPEVLDCLPDTPINLQATAGLPDHPTQATTLHNHPVQATGLHKHPTQATGLYNHPTQVTGLYKHPIQATGLLNHLTQATGLHKHPTQATGLLNHLTQATGLLNHLTQATGLRNRPTQSTSMLNPPTQSITLHNHPTQDTGLTNHPTQATSLLNHTTQTTGVLNPTDKTTGILTVFDQHKHDYPVNTNLLAPTEPLLAGEPCGDLLEQWWFGPRPGVYSSRDMHRKNNKIPVGVLEKGGNINYNKARGEIVSSGNTRNLDKNFNNKENVTNDENRVIKDDNEIEIIGALGSDTFVEKVLLCNSKGKQVITENKRKRPPEHVEVHKKYLMYRENGENVLHDKTDEACVHGRRSEESDSSIKQSLQGYRSCCNTRTDLSDKALRSTNQDTNGNKCPVKISMNIEMSRDSLTRVSQEIPNFRAMVTQKP